MDVAVGRYRRANYGCIMAARDISGLARAVLDAGTMKLVEPSEFYEYLQIDFSDCVPILVLSSP